MGSESESSDHGGGNNELDEEVEDVFAVGVEGMSSNMTLRRTLRSTWLS